MRKKLLCELSAALLVAGMAGLSLGPSNASGQRAPGAASAESARPSGLDADPHLAGWWKFDDASGRIAVDSSKHSRNGTLEGGLAFEKDSVSGRVGKALRLDGKSGFVQITGYKGVTGTRPRTLAAWIKTVTPRGQIMSWGQEDFGRMWIFGFIRGRVGVTPHGGYLYINPAIHDDAWHHVAVVVEEAKSPNLYDNVELYVDGTPAEIHDIGLLDLWPINTGSELDLKIGSSFQGLIDDVRLYDRALSREEIRTLFTSQKSAP
jgi:hypothetical protein